MLKRDITFEDMELPPILYKYRDWNDSFHQNIITKQEVWLAQPSSFEDKYDCKIPIRYDLLTDEEIYQMYLESSFREHPLWSRQRHEAFAMAWTRKTPMKDQQEIEFATKKFFDEFDSRFGVLSLTADNNNPVMWEKYGAKHTGLCIGIDPKIAFKLFGGGGEVNYVKELPIIKPRPFHDFIEQQTLQIYSKLEEWNFEKEYRTHKFKKEPYTPNERIFRLPKEAFNEVILGNKMDEERRKDILAAIKAHLPHVKVS